jgi:translation initiation factor IF-3
MFRGREMSHPERGEALLMKLAEDVKDLGVIEQRPNQDGRNMTMMLGPVKKKEAPAEKVDAAPEAPAAEAPAEAPAQAPAETPAEATAQA